MLPPAGVKPKNGRSRYSKALPAVPIEALSELDSMPRSPIPELYSSDSPPPPPPRSRDRKPPPELRKPASTSVLPSVTISISSKTQSTQSAKTVPHTKSYASLPKTPASSSVPKSPISASSIPKTPISSSIPKPLSSIPRKAAPLPTWPPPTTTASKPPPAPPKQQPSSAIPKPLATLSKPSRTLPEPPAELPSTPPKIVKSTAPAPSLASLIVKDPAAMVIPRRPVAPSQPSSPAPEPSPAVSISSLLSAYARHFDSPVASPAAANSNNYVSEYGRQSSPLRPANDARQPSPLRQTNDAPKEIKKGLPPIPPPQDLVPPPKSPSRSQLPKAELGSTSPPRPEIWRRRPQNSSKGSRELPGLQLEYSHGSTTASQPAEVPAAEPAAAELEAATVPEPLKPPPRNRVPVGGLPGRNIRPNAASAAKEKPASETTTQNTPATTNNNPAARVLERFKQAPTPAPRARPPTPEYRKGDTPPAPVVDMIKKPASPVSSAADSPTRSSPDFSKSLPPQPPKHGVKIGMETSAPRRKPVTNTSPNLSLPIAATPASVERKVLPDPNSAASSSTLSVVTARTSPSDSSSLRQRDSAATNTSASSGNTSRGPVARKLMDLTRYTPTDDPRIVLSGSQGSLFKGKDGTLYPEMKSLNEPDRRALRFPAPRGKVLGKDAIIPAAGIKMSHYNCYQKHKTMSRRSNKYYSLQCQTCQKADSDDRWACSFCHLRLCESCLETFNDQDKDLNRLLTEVARNAPLGRLF